MSSEAVDQLLKKSKKGIRPLVLSVKVRNQALSSESKVKQALILKREDLQVKKTQKSP